MSKNAFVKAITAILLIFCVHCFDISNGLLYASHQCQHIAPKPNQILYSVELEPLRLIRKRHIDKPLRIHLVYDDSLMELSIDKQLLVKDDLMPAAVSYWQKTLQVRQTSRPVRLQRQCATDRVRYRDNDKHPYCMEGCSNLTLCGDIIVPEEHLEACHEAPIGGTFNTTGPVSAGVINADFILYVSAKSLDRCFIGSTVAYAAYCQLEAALDRPVAGYVNLCPESISTKQHDVQQMQSTIKHEILHALGFSAGLFAFFRDSNGDPLTPRLKSTGRPHYNKTLRLYQWSDKVIQSVVRSDWLVRSGHINRTVNVLVTPTVVSEVRRHFNCSSLEGAELEDQGTNGTMLTHWEKRVFENEMMTGTYTQNPIISRITLALMEDTGWYHVNYHNAESYQWGRNLGCEFVKKSCMEWIQNKQLSDELVHPFCTRVKQGNLRTECTQDRDAVALCNLIEYSAPLPTEYQYFTTIDNIPSTNVTYYAGSVVLADYCPYVQEFTWKKDNKIVRGSRCQIEQNNAEADINYSLERYGNSSLCFEHGNQWTVTHCNYVYPVEHWGSGCYQYSCSNVSGLSIIVQDQHLQCLYTGQLLHVTIATTDWLHNGSILCPDCTEICQFAGITCPAAVKPLNRTTQTDDITVPCNTAVNVVLSLGAAGNVLQTLTTVLLLTNISL